jgi:hypothetical protein
MKSSTHSVAVAGGPNDRPGARTRVLAVVLLLRGAIHAAFAAWLIVGRPEWTRIFEIGALCGLADGSLGLLTVSLIVPVAPAGSPRFLAAMTFVDAMGRLATSVALLAFPGIPYFFVTLGPLFGLVGVCTAAVGLVAMTVWTVARVRAGRTWRIDDDELFDPLAFAGVVSLVVGYFLFLDPPATAGALQAMGAGVGGTLAAAFLMAAAGAARHRKSTP